MMEGILVSDSSQLDRRQLLRQATAAGLASALPATVVHAVGSTGDLIKAENEKPGSTDWLLQKTRVDSRTKYRCPWIEGYVSHTSILAGETLSIMVSTNPPSQF